MEDREDDVGEVIATAVRSPRDIDARADFLVPRCKTLRVAAGQRIVELAKAAEVDRSTIVRIEKKLPVTVETAHRVFNVLTGWHPSKNLDEKMEITTAGRKRR